jgi:hypothetical protein
LDIFKNDFKLIDPYEAKIIGSSNLELLFICDCTSSMQPWIEKTKNSIYSIIRYIKAHNKHSSIRIGFVAYRDFKDAKRFEVLGFTEKLEGGLTEGLYLDWKSKARYAILIADAPDHGYPISNFNDDYPNGLLIPHKLD